jgi:hypothetical protein
VKTDGDFEDREGHQAPFTLQEEENVQRPSKMDQDRRARLFELLNLPNDGVEIRPFAGTEFGVERFAIGADFEGAAAGWDQGKRRDPIAELENLSRQTDGFRRVVSNRAVLDPDFGFHRSLLSSREISGKRNRVKVMREDCARRGASTSGRHS